MRNSEICRIKPEDLIELDGIRFVDIKQSKTSGGVRMVPLHGFVYEKLREYIVSENIPDDGIIFNIRDSAVFARANLALGGRFNLSGEQLAERNITFYSGRHFWKTMMSAAGLGEDVEEYFMGHKVSGDVKKRYNHLDKRGETALVGKAREVFAALENYVFMRPYACAENQIE
jgi:integrase